MFSTMNELTMSTPQGQPKPAGPSLLACLNCRQKHQKCDGKTPICGRCVTAGTECQYTPSRRGYKGPSKKRRAEPTPPPSQPETEALFNLDGRSMDIPADWSLPHMLGQQQTVNISPPAPMPSNSSDTTYQESFTIGTPVQPMKPITTPPYPTNAVSNTPQVPVDTKSPLTPESQLSIGGDGYLIDVYYSHFQNAHPILPPLRLFYRSNPPAYLEQVLKFIGAHFTPAASSETYRPTVVQCVVEQEPSPEKVQALLLLAIVLHSRNERPEASSCLGQAIDLAYELGMHRKFYAETYCNGDPIREESLRRTWWELFIIEGLLTALGSRSSFTASMVPPEVPLPCEERIYQEGLAPPLPATIAQFDERVFADEDVDFSSYSYRIEAVRILGRVVALGEIVQGQQEQVEIVDARIASWFHHLPESKSELLRADGTIDEMMFQATMIVNGATIYLHFPRSDLLSSPAVAAEVICGHSGQCMMPAFSHHAHAMKAVKAASELSTLAAIRMPVTKHTPFFICSLVLSSIVQLAAYSVKAGQMPDPRRDRLTLTVGVFKSLGRTWAISQAIIRQIKAVARDVLEIGVRPAVDQNALDFTAFLEGSQFWLPEPTAK